MYNYVYIQEGSQEAVDEENPRTVSSKLQRDFLLRKGSYLIGKCDEFQSIKWFLAKRDSLEEKGHET
jgi:hypothetical protein